MKNHMATTFLILSSLIALTSVSFAQADGKTILKNMLDAEAKAAFTAHQVTTLSRGPAVTSAQIIYRDGFKGMRMEYLEPPKLKGEVRADDGKILAHYIPREKLVRIQPSRMAGSRSWAAQIERAFQQGHLEIEVVGRDRIAGRNAHVIVVKPKLRDKGPTRKFWVDTENWVKLKTEDIAPDGTITSTSYYTRINFVNSIPPEKFRFQPPPGVRVVREPRPAQNLSIEEARKRAGFRVLLPSYLPQGFKFAGASVMDVRNNKIVSLRYTDGVTSFSLFQTAGRRLNPRMFDDGGNGKSIRSWRSGNLNLMIVGRISKQEMERVAKSVK